MVRDGVSSVGIGRLGWNDYFAGCGSGGGSMHACRRARLDELVITMLKSFAVWGWRGFGLGLAWIWNGCD